MTAAAFCEDEIERRRFGSDKGREKSVYTDEKKEGEGFLLMSKRVLYIYSPCVHSYDGKDRVHPRPVT